MIVGKYWQKTWEQADKAGQNLPWRHLTQMQMRLHWGNTCKQKVKYCCTDTLNEQIQSVLKLESISQLKLKLRLKIKTKLNSA